MRDIIHHLAHNLTDSIGFKKGIAIARLDEEGRVLLQDETTNEYRYAGLNDYEDSYFYIRHRDTGEILFGESSQKNFVSFQSFYTMTYQMRIVACMKNINPYELEHKIRFSLMNASLPNSGSFANAEIKPISSQIDSIQVLRDESKGAKPFDKNLIFVAHDFDITADIDMSLEYYCENPCYNQGC